MTLGADLPTNAPGPLRPGISDQSREQGRAAAQDALAFHLCPKSVLPASKTTSTLTSICLPSFLPSLSSHYGWLCGRGPGSAEMNQALSSSSGLSLGRQTGRETGVLFSHSMRKAHGANRAKRNKKWNTTKPVKILGDFPEEVILDLNIESQ